MIIDNFIDSFKELKIASINGNFSDVVNDVDDIAYPLISQDIPKNVQSDILRRLEIVHDRPLKDHIMFMRRSPIGINYPHQVHSDVSMGDYSLMLYINNYPGGTSLLKHKKSGIAYNPESQEFVDLIVNDGNTPEAWEITEMVHMRPNRAFIFRSDLLHRAEPIGGIGEGAEARVVLTCFFS